MSIYTDYLEEEKKKKKRTDFGIYGTFTPSQIAAKQQKNIFQQAGEAITGVVSKVSEALKKKEVISPIPSTVNKPSQPFQVQKTTQKTTLTPLFDEQKISVSSAKLTPEGERVIKMPVKSFAAGIGDVEYSIGRTATWLGQDGIGTKLSKQGEYVQSFAPPDELGKFEWNHLYDPRFYATTIMRSLPFSLSLMPLAIIGGVAGTAIAGGIGLGAFGTLILGSLGAAALARPMESALEAGNAYDEAIKKGKTPEQATIIANKTFKGNMALTTLDAAEFALAFAPVKGGSSLLKRILKGTAGVAGNMFMEGTEEVIQQNIQNVAAGEKIDITSPEVQEQFAVGGLMGAGLELSGQIYNNIKKNVMDQSPVAQKTYTEEILKGKTIEEAEQKAVNVAAQKDPEGIKAIIETTIADATIPRISQTVKTSEVKGKIVSPPTGGEVGGVVNRNVNDLVVHEGAPDVGQVSKYVEEIKAGGKPPLIVVKEGNKWGVEDGKHKLEAYKQVGVTEVPTVEKIVTPKVVPKTVSVPKEQLPVGQGKKKVSKLEARMKGIIGKATPEQIQALGLSTSNTAQNDKQLADAAKYVINNQQEALDVIEGKIDAPKGLLKNAVFIALTKQAELDPTLAIKLAGLYSKRYGQEIQILSEIDKDNPVRLLNEVYNIRVKAVEKRYGKPVKEIVKKEVKDIKSEITLENFDVNAFIDSIETCA